MKSRFHLFRLVLFLIGTWVVQILTTQYQLCSGDGDMQVESFRSVFSTVYKSLLRPSYRSLQLFFPETS